jgi:GNAT superfamily N-acetyltransferase
MRALATTDPTEFKTTAFPYLQADPVLNSVLLTNTEDRIRGILHDPSPPVFLTIHADDDQVIGAVLCTDYRGINLGALPDDLIPALVDTCLELAPNPDLVEGTATAALRLAEQLAVRRGKTVEQVRAVRLHKLGTFVEQKADGGSPRLAVPADLDRLVVMMGDYGRELGHSLAVGQDEAWTQARIDRERLWVWERDGRIVALVGHQNAVYGATRVGPVYTPPADRGHGYASALTAHVTSRILAGGSAACLYTDLTNPTSNKIYAAIGYRPLADFVGYGLR